MFSSKKQKGLREKGEIRKPAFVKVSPPEPFKKPFFSRNPFLEWIRQISSPFRQTALFKVLRSETSGKLKKTANRPKQQTPSSDLEWFFSTPALICYLGLMFFHLGSLYYQPLLDYLRHVPALQVSLQVPIWNGGASWSQNLPILDSIEIPENLFLLENWKESVFHVLKKNPWIKKASIQYQFPKNVHILAQIRKPCLWVEQHSKKYLVDREGFRLPDVSNFPEPLLIFEGIKTPVPEIGANWNDSKILEACELALFFRQQHLYDWLSLEKIQLNSETDPEMFDLITRHQTRIRWGRRSSQIHCDPKTQVQILKQFCRSYPDLQGISLADIRFEEDSFVCFP